jgi:hypothetical protein
MERRNYIPKPHSRGIQYHDIMEFGSLLRKLLGGKGITSLDAVEKDLISRRNVFIKMNQISARVKILTHLVGWMTIVGLHYQGIISDFKKVAKRRGAIEWYLPTDRKATAGEIRQFFLEKLEDLMPADLEMVSTINHRETAFFSLRYLGNLTEQLAFNAHRERVYYLGYPEFQDSWEEDESIVYNSTE